MNEQKLDEIIRLLKEIKDILEEKNQQPSWEPIKKFFQQGDYRPNIFLDRNGPQCLSSDLMNSE